MAQIEITKTDKTFIWIVNLVIAISMTLLGYFGNALLTDIKSEMKEINTNLKTISNKMASQDEINKFMELRIKDLESEVKELHKNKKNK